MAKNSPQRTLCIFYLVILNSSVYVKMVHYTDVEYLFARTD